MKLKDACRMFAKELGYEEGFANEAEIYCSSIRPGEGDVELNESEIEMARELFVKAMKTKNEGFRRISKDIAGN